MKLLLQQARDALQYAADDMSPIGVNNCTCPICAAIAALDAELAKPAGHKSLPPFTEEQVNAMLDDALNAELAKPEPADPEAEIPDVRISWSRLEAAVNALGVPKC